MLKLKKIAITGGLASGKSTACQFFKELGAHVISADQIVHQFLSPNHPHGQEIIKLLGNEILEEKSLNRALIAEKIFNEPDKLAAIENILHPAVLQAIDQEAEKIEKMGSHALFVAEIPLLYEADMAHHFDAVVALDIDFNTARERYCLQGNEDEFEKRMKRQLSPEEKTKKADYTLSNNGNIADLKEQVTQLYKYLTS